MLAIFDASLNVLKHNILQSTIDGKCKFPWKSNAHGQYHAIYIQLANRLVCAACQQTHTHTNKLAY